MNKQEMQQMVENKVKSMVVSNFKKRKNINLFKSIGVYCLYLQGSEQSYRIITNCLVLC